MATTADGDALARRPLQCSCFQALSASVDPPRGADTRPLLLGPDRKLLRDHIACATRPRFLTINSPIESKSLSRNEKNQSQSRVVTGGVVSGLGKGVTASSIGVLLKACGHRVTSIKIGAVEERRVWRERRRKSRPPLPLVAAAVKQTASSPQKKPLALLQKKNSTKNRPVPQHRRRHDVPLRARRGVCTGRRRRGESLGVLIDRDGTEKREREKRRVSHPPSRPRPSSKKNNNLKTKIKKGRPRPRQLRALPRPDPNEGEQPDDGEDLPARPGQGEARGLPREDGAGEKKKRRNFFF